MNYLTPEARETVRQMAQEYLDAGYSPLAPVHLILQGPDAMISTPLQPGADLSGHTERYFLLGVVAGLPWTTGEYGLAERAWAAWESMDYDKRMQAVPLAIRDGQVWRFRVMTCLDAMREMHGPDSFTYTLF